MDNLVNSIDTISDFDLNNSFEYLIKTIPNTHLQAKPTLKAFVVLLQMVKIRMQNVQKIN